MKDDTPRHSKDDDAPATQEPGAAAQTRPQPGPPLPSFGIFSSGDPNFADRIDELMKGFGEDHLEERESTKSDDVNR